MHGIQRHRIAGITRSVDGVQADNFARQGKAQHLLVAKAVVDEGLDHAGAHRSDCIEGFTRAEDVVARMVRPNVVDHHVQLVQRRLVIALRTAGIGERTGRAEMQRVTVAGSGWIRRRGSQGAAQWGCR